MRRHNHIVLHPGEHPDENCRSVAYAYSREPVGDWSAGQRAYSDGSSDAIVTAHPAEIGRANSVERADYHARPVARKFDGFGCGQPAALLNATAALRALDDLQHVHVAAHVAACVAALAGAPADEPTDATGRATVRSAGHETVVLVVWLERGSVALHWIGLPCSGETVPETFDAPWVGPPADAPIDFQSAQI